MRNCLKDILNANTHTDKSRIETASSKKTGNPLPYSSKNTWRCVVSSKIGKATPIPAERNRPAVLQKGVDYANWFMRHAVVNHSIFVDEFWYNICTARARMGERAYRHICGQRGRNVTVTLATSPTNGFVFYSAFLGAMTGQRFNDFLTQT